MKRKIRRAQRTEADLRGSLNNDSLTEDERRQIEEEREAAEEAALLRVEDFQLSYAVDLIKGLATIAQAQLPQQAQAQ